MLELIDLHAEVAGTPILRGLSLTVGAGQIHAIMGPNASGKSTLSKVITGHPDYRITSGDVRFEGRSMLDAEPEERSHAGIFLSFQHPVEIPGVTTSVFLKEAVNAKRRALGEPELDAADFLRLAKHRMGYVEMDKTLLHRSLNEGFSGGERKRNEVFQLAMLDPKLAILDEPDSGLDVDAMKIVAEGVQRWMRPEPDVPQVRDQPRALLVITHYQRLLDHLTPDFTHVLLDGRIVRSGGPELAHQVEARGYQWVRDEVAA